jgi:hypothetical protein
LKKIARRRASVKNFPPRKPGRTGPDFKYWKRQIRTEWAPQKSRSASLGVQGGLLGFQFGHQFFGLIDGVWIQDELLNPAIAFDLLIDLDALFAHGTPLYDTERPRSAAWCKDELTAKLFKSFVVFR